MASAWLTTLLTDYEAHIELVGQGPAVRAMLRDAITWLKPESLFLLGCAGGNGLEAIEGSTVQRVDAVDLNPDYLAEASRRWGHLPGIRFTAFDLNRGLPPMAPVDLAFGALVLEYLDDPLAAVRRVGGVLGPCGVFAVALLRASLEAPAVVESPYRERLMSVGAEFRPLSAETVAKAGLKTIRRRRWELPAAKWFEEIWLKRPE